MRTKQIESDYREYLEGLKGGCPFCPIRENKIKADMRYWKILYNKFPYENTKNHYVIVLKRHVDNDKMRDLNNGEVQELWDIILMYPEMEFIHKNLSQQSVNHLHCHLIDYR